MMTEKGPYPFFGDDQRKKGYGPFSPDARIPNPESRIPCLS
jgi:hypothetical protein